MKFKLVMFVVLIIVIVLVVNFHSIVGAIRKEVKEDIASKTFYQNKLANLNSVTPPENAVILLGDSIFHGFKINVESETPIVNYSIPGDTTSLLLQRMPGLRFSENNRVILLIGVNDLGINVAATEIIQNIALIIQHLELTVQEVIIAKLILTNGITRSNSQIESVNRLIEKKFGSDHRILDFNIDLRLRIGSAWQYTTDGIHLNDHGYEILEQVLNTVVQNNTN